MWFQRGAKRWWPWLGNLKPNARHPSQTARAPPTKATTDEATDACVGASALSGVTG